MIVIHAIPDNSNSGDDFVHLNFQFWENWQRKPPLFLVKIWIILRHRISIPPNQHTHYFACSPEFFKFSSLWSLADKLVVEGVMSTKSITYVWRLSMEWYYISLSFRICTWISLHCPFLKYPLYASSTTINSTHSSIQWLPFIRNLALAMVMLRTIECWIWFGGCPRPCDQRP